MLKWGIIATGHIAGVFAGALRESTTGLLLAVASRRQESANRFADKFGVERRYDNYQRLLDDPDVEAVYISTPHTTHAQWAIKAAEAKKHVLCEKPFAINLEQAKNMVEAARTHKTFLMEAFAYRCHPQTVKMVELVRDGCLGEVRSVSATFSLRLDADPGDRVLRHDLAGGAILDLGCYCTSMVRLVAGAAAGMNFAEPVEFSACGCIGESSRVDEYSVAVSKFPGGIVAQLATGIQMDRDNVVEIHGTKGSLYIPRPWDPGRTAAAVAMYLRLQGKQGEEEIKTMDTRNLWTIEADTVAECICSGRQECAAVTWQDSLGNMQMLDSWRRDVGMIYDFE